MKKLKEDLNETIKKMVNSLPLEEQEKVVIELMRDRTILSLTNELAHYRQLCKKLLEEKEQNSNPCNSIAEEETKTK